MSSAIEQFGTTTPPPCWQTKTLDWRGNGWGCFNPPSEQNLTDNIPLFSVFVLCYLKLGIFTFSTDMTKKIFKAQKCNPQPPRTCLYIHIVTQCLGLYSQGNKSVHLSGKTLPFRLPKLTAEDSYWSKPVAKTTCLLQLHISTLKTILIAKCTVNIKAIVIEKRGQK